MYRDLACETSLPSYFLRLILRHSSEPVLLEVKGSYASDMSCKWLDMGVSVCQAEGNAGVVIAGFPSLNNTPLASMYLSYGDNSLSNMKLSIWPSSG